MKHKSFILEIALDVAIFLTCAAICCALTVRANLIAKDSERLVRAVGLAQTAAEQYAATGDIQDGHEEEGLRILETKLTDTSACIQIFHDDDLIYELKEVPYVPR